MKPITRVTIVLALLTAAACSDVDEPTAQDYNDIARNVAPLIAQDFKANGTFAVTADLALGSRPSVLQLDTNGTVTGQLGDFEWNVSLSCRDGLGNSQSACDETTDSATLDVSLAGNLSFGGFAASLDVSHNGSIEGLQSNELRIAGSSRIAASTTLSVVVPAIESSFDLDYNGSYDVTVPVADPLAASGGLAANVDVQKLHNGPNSDVDLHFVVDVDVELNGDGTATIILDGNVRFTLNLRTGNVTGL